MRIGGAEYGELGTGAGKRQGGGTKVVPSGDSDSTITFEVFIKSIMQAPSNQQVFLRGKEADAKRKRNQLKQVAFALLAIVLFLGSGAVFYPLVEGWTVLDCFTWHGHHYNCWIW